MPHLPDRWIVSSLAQGEVTPGEGFQDPPWEKEKEELQLLRGGKPLWGGWWPAMFASYTPTHTPNMSYLYTVYNSAHRHTHTHTYTLFFLWWGWCQHISCNSWFTHSVCLGQSEASEASEKKQKKASAPKAKAAGGHPKLFAALHRVYLF